MVKNSPTNATDPGDAGLIPGLGRSPGGGKWQPTPVFLPGESHGQRSLVGYSPWGCKELEMTERLTLSLSLSKEKVGFFSPLIKLFCLGRSPGEGNGNPLQYSCLENPMNGGAC